MVAVQEGHGTLDTAVGVRLIGIDTHDMNFMRAFQPEHLEHLQGTSRVQAAIIRHDHYLPCGEGGGHGDDRAWTLFEHHLEGLVGLLLRFKVKKGVLPEHDEVIPLRLQKDVLGRETNILKNLAGDICLGTAPRTVLQELLYLVAGVRE
jgi:hypothetical protein